MDSYNKHYNELTKVACVILTTMFPELQKSFESLGDFDISERLKEIFQEKDCQERFGKSLMTCKHQDGNYICVHVQKMKSYIDKLRNLGVEFPKKLSVDVVFNFLLVFIINSS